MFRYVLSLTFAVGCATAATISTSALCDGMYTVGTFSASCNNLISQAQASLEIVGHFRVFAEASTTDFGAGEDIATANFSDDYVFTVTVGTGAGFFLPCFSGGGDGTVTMSFGGVTGDGTFGFLDPTFCSHQPFFPFPPSQPFTFGVQQIVHLTMHAQVQQPLSNFHGIVSESLDHILFLDPTGNLLPNATFTLVEVPEPAAWSMLMMGLIFLSGGIRCLSTFFLSH